MQSATPIPPDVSTDPMLPYFLRKLRKSCNNFLPLAKFKFYGRF